LKILYFGNYDPKYSRNRVLIKGLRKNGVEVLECNSRSYSFLKYFFLKLKYLKYIGKFDAMIVGFPGHKAMFLARMLTRKPIIFDAFTSHYGGMILDRKKYPINNWHSRFYRFLDRWSCKLADLVLLDTNAHIDYFVDEYKIARDKFKVLYVGTDTDIFYPKKINNTGKLLIHFHGSFIPLQGVEYIIKAAKLLSDDNVVFNIIGRGQTYKNNIKLAKQLKINNIKFINSVSYNELPNYIGRADISLGIFGNSPKTELVIPNKVYEAMACAKAVITADTKAVKEIFRNGENILLCKKADPRDIADKILSLKNDKKLKDKISTNGYEYIRKNLTEKIIGNELKQIIYSKI